MARENLQHLDQSRSNGGYEQTDQISREGIEESRQQEEANDTSSLKVVQDSRTETKR